MNRLLSGRRVLIVEDEMVVAWGLETTLKDLGCTVIGPVARVKEALALIETAEALDGVVLDVNLNGENSYPVADALVARGIPFVFSTGYNRDFFPEVYRSFPMLQKPYTDSELAAALIRLLTPEDPELPAGSLKNPEKPVKTATSL